MANNLASYQLDTLALLRDSSGQFTNTTMLNRYINKARTECAKRSACLQALITGQAPFGTGAQAGNMIPGAIIPNMLPNAAANNANEPGVPSTPSNNFVTIPGVEVYSYNYARPYLRQQYTGYDSVIYVSDIAVSWGGFRPTMNWMPWDQLQAQCRSYNIGSFSYPVIWSQKGLGQNGQVWMFPVPINTSFAEMEWEAICTPSPLYTNDDYEALPELYQNLIPYYAAYHAYLAQQRTGMAEIMRGLFEEQLLINGVASDWGHSDTHYPDGI